MRRDLRNSHHLATISHDGRFWDAYLELAETQGANEPARGRIAFSAADAGAADPIRTATIFVEDTAQEVVARAREFKTHQLVALLRSAVPEEGAETPESGDTAGSPPEETPPDSGRDQGEAGGA